MNKRARHYAMTGIVVLVAALFARLAGHWSDLAFYATGAGILAVMVVVGMFWLESAPDGAFRGGPTQNG